MKRIRREFYFTKKERKSLLILSFIIVILLIGLLLIYKFDKPKVYTFTELGLENIVEKKDPLQTNKKVSKTKVAKKQRYKFDPNTITEDSLKALGIKQYAINNLLKYRSKGGMIKDVEHFYKIYGMENYKGEFDEYMLFKASATLPLKNHNPDIQYTKENNKNTNELIVDKKPISIVSLKRVDINRSDSFELQSLKGIGSVMAKRMIKYRDALGGFYDVSQLEEVYGLSTQTYMDINHLIEVDNAAIKKININDVDEAELEKHPYITKKQASIIIKYRNNHGKYQNFEDFSKVKIFSNEELIKLRNYISY